MWQELLLKLDDRQWPQRFVPWAPRKRQPSSLEHYLFPKTARTHAVSLTVAPPLLSHKDLFNGIVPTHFGSWRDFEVRHATSQGNIAVVHLFEPRSETEFVLVVPVHSDFAAKRWKHVKHLRLACEAQRARLITVREPNGKLLAAGTLEITPRAAYSEEVQG